MAKTKIQDSPQVVQPAKSATAPAFYPAVQSSYALIDSESVLKLAAEVKRFISENNLFQNIQGSQHVNVEGWQYAGARLGIVPIVEYCEEQAATAAASLRYKASVRLVQLSDREEMGRGIAYCDNSEKGKKFYQEYAIASMAQTRAIGKAYRTVIGWLITAAGFNTTPLEELDYERDAAQPKQLPKKEQAAVDPATVAMTSEQEQQIRSMCTSELLSEEEKSKTLAALGKLSMARAASLIENLSKTLEKRGDLPF